MSKDNIIDFRPARERWKKVLKERLRERLRRRLREEEQRKEEERKQKERASKLVPFRKKHHYKDEEK
jgi:hypothetical protein